MIKEIKNWIISCFESSSNDLIQGRLAYQEELLKQLRMKAASKKERLALMKQCDANEKEIKLLMQELNGEF